MLSQPEPFIPLAQAAQRLGVSWATAYRCVLTGKLRGIFITGRWLVDPHSVATLLEERRRASQVA